MLDAEPSDPRPGTIAMGSLFSTFLTLSGAERPEPPRVAYTGHRSTLN